MSLFLFASRPLTRAPLSEATPRTARIPMIAMTIRSSMRVKLFLMLCF